MEHLIRFGKKSNILFPLAIIPNASTSNRTYEKSMYAILFFRLWRHGSYSIFYLVEFFTIILEFDQIFITLNPIRKQLNLNGFEKY
jgi:hypothetical protein